MFQVPSASEGLIAISHWKKCSLIVVLQQILDICRSNAGILQELF